MKKTGFSRKIDELGRIVLPIEIRHTLDIKERDFLEISLLNDGIFLKKEQNYCIFCSSILSLTTFEDKKICKKCLNKIKTIV